MKIEEIWHNVELFLRTSLTLPDISKDISNLRPQENNTSSFNYFQLEHLLDSDSEFVALLRLEVRSQCPNWPMSMDYLSCPNKYQATPSGDCGFSFVSFRCGHIPAVTVRCDRTTKTKRQTRYRCLWETPWGTLFTANAFPLSIIFLYFPLFSVVSAKIIQTFPILTKTKKFGTGKASTQENPCPCSFLVL